MTQSLNYDIDAQLCGRTAAIYNFIYRKLVDASVQRSADVAREALGLIQYQRETWTLLLKKLQQEGGQSDRAKPPSGDVPGVSEEESPEAEAVYGTLSVEG